MTARFCMACGGPLGTVREEGRVRRRCRRCGWTYYGNPVPAVLGILERRGRILMVRRARPPYAGTWDLPGGFLEADEDPEVGLGRELREELGVRIRRARFVGFATDRYGRGGFPVLAALYRVSAEPGPITPADDVTEARWFPLAQVPIRAIAFPSMRRELRRYLAARRLVRGRERIASSRGASGYAGAPRALGAIGGHFGAPDVLRGTSRRARARSS